MDLAAFDPFDVEHDQAVVEQQRIAAADVFRQILVVEPDTLLVAQFDARVEHERGAGAQRDAPALELADPDLRPLQVGHDRDVAADAAQPPRAHVGALEMVFGRTVREVEAHDVDTGGKHALEHERIARRGAERGNDLGAAWHGGFRGSIRRAARGAPQ